MARITSFPEVLASEGTARLSRNSRGSDDLYDNGNELKRLLKIWNSNQELVPAGQQFNGLIGLILTVSVIFESKVVGGFAELGRH